MGVSTITAARILKGQLEGHKGEESVLNWETFPHTALSKTYNQDHQTPDSAGTVTAYLCGVKTNKGVIGVDARTRRGNCQSSKGHELTSLLDWSLAQGKSVGIVTTTRITHATPAGAYAHTAERDWEGDHDVSTTVTSQGCKDIARQLVEDNPKIQVIMGGGRRYFLSASTNDPETGSNSHYGRQDGRNLIQSWMNEKYNRGVSHRYVWNATDFHTVDPAKTDYLLDFTFGVICILSLKISLDFIDFTQMKSSVFCRVCVFTELLGTTSLSNKPQGSTCSRET